MRLSDRTRALLRQWLPWLLLAVAVVATAAVYWPGLTGGWVFDDYPNIVDNAAIHITPGHASLVAWIDAALSSTSSFLHRPLASITFAANWYFSSGGTWAFKFTNVLIHLLNGVLLFCMLRALLRLVAWRCQASTPPPLRGDPLPSETGVENRPPSEQSGTERDGFAFIDAAAATRLALIVAAAWLLLPINLMAVLYVVQRMASLAQVFVLAGLWAYLAGRRRMLTADTHAAELRGLSLAVTGIVLGTLIGVTSKETAVLLPVYAFLAEVVVLGFKQRAGRHPVGRPESPTRPPMPEDPHRSRLPPLLQGAAKATKVEGNETSVKGGANKQDKRLWTLFTVTLFLPGILGFLWLLRHALEPSAYAHRPFTLIQRLMTEPRVLVDYLHWTILPNPMVLSLYHDEFVKSTGLLSPWTTLGAMLLLAALIVIAVLVHKRHPLVALGIGWFFAGQLLTATIVPLELVYEQRMYFSSIGVLLALGVLLLGTRWRIRWALPRALLVAVALVWYPVATNLRAQEWSNQLQLAIDEAARHPTSPRAVYEAGRLLLIASDYKPGKVLDRSWKYLRHAAAIPYSSILPDQAMIMIADHDRQGNDAAFWHSVIHKLRTQPTKQEDISGLVALTRCRNAGICRFSPSRLQRAYQAALSRPYPSGRLDAAYARFQRDLMGNDALAMQYLARAVHDDPHTAAYRIDLSALYARHGRTQKALQQIDALRRMNAFGRLDKQISMLAQIAEQSRTTAR